MRVRNHQVIYKCIVGSHAYGTNVPGSDIDYKGIYIQSPRSVYYEGYVPQIEMSKDETYYEVGRFLSLCEKANPTMLELLYMPKDCEVFKHDIFNTILKSRHKYLTKTCRHSFGGYAVEQIKKARGLDKKMNWEQERVERKGVLDFCYVRQNCGSIPVMEFLESFGVKQEQIGLVNIPHMRDCYGMYWDYYDEYEGFKPQGIVKDLQNSNDVSLTSIPDKMCKDSELEYTMYFNKDAYTVHCREYKEYQQWLKERNTQRYVDVKNHGQMVDGKNLLHCFRLIETAIEIPEQKIINVRRPNAKDLVGIRKGEFNLKYLLEMAEGMIEEMDKVYAECDLPDKADSTFNHLLTMKVREMYEKALNTKEIPY